MAQANKDGTKSIKRKARRATLLGASIAGSKAVRGVANAYHEGTKRIAEAATARKRVAQEMRLHRRYHSDSARQAYSDGLREAKKGAQTALRSQERAFGRTAADISTKATRSADAAVKRTATAAKNATAKVGAAWNELTAAPKRLDAAKSAHQAATARHADAAKRAANVSKGPSSLNPFAPRTAKDLRNAKGALAKTRSALTSAEQGVPRAQAAFDRAVDAQGKAFAAAKKAKDAAPVVRQTAYNKSLTDATSRARRALDKVDAARGEVRQIQGKERGVLADIKRRHGVGSKPEATRFQKGVVKAREALDSAKAKLTGAKDLPGRVAQKAGLGSRQAVSAATKQALGNGRTAKVLGGAAKHTGKALGASAKAVGKIAAAPVKGISAGLRGIESLGKIATAGNTGRMANVIRGATSASGLAGGFAAGAWIDAGLNAASHFAEQAALKDAGRRAMQEAVLNGADAETANRIGREIAEMNTVGATRTEKASNGNTIVRKNPGWSDVIFSREYGKEVLKGLSRALTLGLAGTGDDTAIDRAFEKSPEEQAAEQNIMFRRELEGRDARTGEVLRTGSGARAYSQDEINARIKKYDEAMAARQASTQNAQRWYGYRTQNDLSVDNMATLIAEATKARDDRYAQADDLSQVRKGAALLRGPDVDENGKSKEDRYRDTVRSNADKDFDKRISYLLENTDASNKFMEQKRAQVYNVLYGGDYSKFGSDRGPNGNADYQEFNKAWGAMSGKERLLFDVEGFAKQLAADTDAAYEKIKADAAAQKSKEGEG